MQVLAKIIDCVEANMDRSAMKLPISKFFH